LRFLSSLKTSKADYILLLCFGQALASAGAFLMQKGTALAVP